MYNFFIVTRRFRRCVEAHVSRVAVRTDKAGRGIVKGARAEEEYFLMDILSGCMVKSRMSVTGIVEWSEYRGYV